MIKLIVIARCIPEDVYLRSIEQPSPLLAGEKKFSVVVREPESWYIGRLAIEIKSRYESLYKRPFGQIKYLKDGDDDCDLDPELSVADLLVDEGKAAKDGADQKRIVKVIQEQGRAIRQGSVVPDLTPLHYQPPLRPPVPKFPGLEKRTAENIGLDGRPTKRQRLDQIDEDDSENIVRSIEGNTSGYSRIQENEINGDSLDHPLLEPKQESPEDARPWVNTAPATKDELELLPQPPENWQQRSRPGGLALSASSRPQAGGARDASNTPHDYIQNHRTPSSNRGGESLMNRVVRQQSLTNAQTPITPPYTVNAGHTPAAQAVSVLNGMKSASPAVRQSTSSSASKFRKTKKNVYDPPESDIDDSQMSPGSRASRSKITPKLIRTNNNVIPGRNSASTSSKNDANMKGVTKMHDHKDKHDVAVAKRQQLPQSRNPNQQNATLQHNNASSTGLEKSSTLAEPISAHMDISVDKAAIVSQENLSVLNSDETWSTQDDGSKRKRKRDRQPSKSKSKSRSKSDGNPSTSRSTSVTSSDQSSTQRAMQPNKIKRIAPTKVADTSDQYDYEDNGILDSPGAQLEETLRQSSPIQQKPKQFLQNKLEKQARSGTTSKPASASSESTNNADEENIVTRPPHSVSDLEDPIPPLNIPKRQKQARQHKGKEPADNRRCFSCWQKKSRCDNRRPKCSTCEKNLKTCQIYNMTKEAAIKEKEARKAAKTANSSSKSTPKPSARPRQKSKSSLSEELVSATDGDEDSGDEKASAPSKTSDKKVQQQLNVVKRPKNATESPSNEENNQKSRATEEILQENEKDAAKSNISNKPTKIVHSGRVNEPSGKLSIPEVGYTNRERSTESYATSNNRILPPGMTQEEYDVLIKGRAGLTEDQRRAQKLYDKKANKQKEKEATPLIPRSQSTQDPVQQSQKQSASIKSDEKVPSSTQSSSKRSQPSSSSQHAKAAPSTPIPPVSVPLETKTTSNQPKATHPATHNSISNSKLKLHPTVATTAAAIDSNKHQNPPYRPPQQKSLPTTPAATASGLPKSLKDFRAQLQEQKKTGSSASTPQPQSAAAKLLASASNKQQAVRKGFSLDDDEDDDDDDDSDEDEEEGNEDDETASEDHNSQNRAKPKQPSQTLAQTGATPGLVTSDTGKVLVRRRARTPSNSGSDSSGSADW